MQLKILASKLISWFTPNKIKSKCMRKENRIFYFRENLVQVQYLAYLIEIEIK